MKTAKTNVLARACGLAAVALLALSFTFAGPRVVRADDPETLSSLRDMVFVPIMKALHDFDQRLMSFEAHLTAYAGSFTCQHITTEQLCVADASGEQTCITKTQLDMLLKIHAMANASQGSASLLDINTPLPEQATEIATTEPGQSATNAVAEEALVEDHEPLFTGSIALPTIGNSAVSGDALIWDAEVEISVPDLALDND